jgi:HAE1 family hydrophobic/amphiphilic exporter-1
MDYMTSQSYAGNSKISVYFPSYTDKNIDQVNVQNRVAQALPKLPSTVQQLGISTKAASTSILMVYGIYSENNKYDNIFISDYVDLNITDVLKRVPGVGDVSVFGNKQNAMRLWLNPNELSSRGLTILDVASALKSQNIVVGAGSIGQEPVPQGQSYELPLRIKSRFSDPSNFENLVVKIGSDSTLVKLKDIGRVEIGAENYFSNARVNAQEGIGLAIYQSPGSNALDVAENIQKTMAELGQNFPPGMKAEIVYDTTAFIQTSIKEVFITLLQAIGLVILVIYCFLQDWRTTIIPAIAIPVALIGSLAFPFLFGFSINSLTMFGLILATGVVVDDAIVIVEAVSAKLEQGLTARQASIEVMDEMTGAVISTSLVLLAVFIPVAFFPGTTGKLYQQFALIMAFAIVCSTFNALSFSPSMAAVLLRSPQPARGPLGWFFRKFNQLLAWIRDRYQSIVEFLIRVRYLVIAIFVAALFGTYYMFQAVPTGFVPAEDQGVILGMIQAPDGVSLSYTDQVVEQVGEIMGQIPEIEANFITSGTGFEGGGSNQGLFFAKLKPWSERTNQGQNVEGVLQRLNRAFSQIDSAIVAAFNPPAIPGFGSTGGFEMMLQDRTGGKLSIDEFLVNAQETLATANQQPAIAGRAYTQFTAGTPQLQIEINRNKLESLNIDFQQAMQTLGASIGSQYVNDFVLGTRSYKAYVQLDGNYRNSPEDINKLYLRSRDNQMIPIGEVATITPITGPQTITHYNGYRSIKLQGSQAPGYSSGQAIATMDEAVKTTALPGVIGNWIGLAKEEIAAGSLGALVFLFGIIMVFLTLSAQYESYIDPIIILLSVPLAMLGALLLLSMRGLVNDVYANVALVMLIGLASKNAILIVEFANQARAEGLTIFKAAQKAAAERFRPILMTAISSLVGFFPLVIATGAGAASRWSIGTALFGGLLIATILSLLVVPVLYVVIKSLESRFLDNNEPPKGTGSQAKDLQKYPELEQSSPVAGQTARFQNDTP